MKKTEVLTILQTAGKALEEFFTVPKIEEIKELVFESAKLKEGDSIINYSSKEVGATVEISTANGSESAPNGAYELENGFAFKVKDGVIEEITSDETPAEEVADAPAQELEEVKVEDAPAEVAQPNEEVEALKAKVDELEKAIEAIKSAMASKEDFSAITNEIKTLNSAVNILANTPEEFSKVDTTNEAKDEKENKLKALASILSNRK